MKKLIIALGTIVSLACITTPPLCGVGQRPMCFCDSNGQNCGWVCVGK